ncbi:MAG: DUF5009 domain-containing protein [Chitinophagaceae bacterium]
MNQTQSSRVVSIDILRAITMLLMIFVNDLWSLTNIPGWLEHTQAAEDGMGLADTVFPAFLFITGMSIPLAVAHRRSKGDSNGQILIHILLRGIALLVMGVFNVNGESIDEAGTGMLRVVWNMITWTCFIFLWNAWPEKMNKVLLNGLKIAAVIILLALAWIYRGSGHNDQLSRFAPHWWGILGLIGWAYLVSAIIYALSGNKFSVIIIAWLLFNFLCGASHAGWLSSIPFLKTILSPLGGGAMPAFVTGGTLTTMIFLHYRNKNEDSRMAITLFIFALILIAAGFYLRQFWGISKIRATPAWVLICSGITILMFLIIYFIADVNKKVKWFDIIKPAGTNTLVCYMIPYFAYAVAVLSHVKLPAALLDGGIGLIKSFLFALLTVMFAGVLGKWGLRLKL